MHIHAFIHLYVARICICVYVYIQRKRQTQRDRHRERDRETDGATVRNKDMVCLSVIFHTISEQNFIMAEIFLGIKYIWKLTYTHMYIIHTHLCRMREREQRDVQTCG